MRHRDEREAMVYWAAEEGWQSVQESGLGTPSGPTPLIDALVDFVLAPDPEPMFSEPEAHEVWLAREAARRRARDALRTSGSE